MNDDPTIRLPRDPNDNQQSDDRLDQLILLVAQMLKELQSLTVKVDSIDLRLTGLETKVDQRLKETQPLWAVIDESLATINTRLDKADANLDSFRYKTEQSLDNIKKVVNTTRNDMLELRTDFRGFRHNLRQQFPDMELG